MEFRPVSLMSVVLGMTYAYIGCTHPPVPAKYADPRCAPPYHTVFRNAEGGGLTLRTRSPAQYTMRGEPGCEEESFLFADFVEKPRPHARDVRVLVYRRTFIEKHTGSEHVLQRIRFSDLRDHPTVHDPDTEYVDSTGAMYSDWQARAFVMFEKSQASPKTVR